MLSKKCRDYIKKLESQYNLDKAFDNFLWYFKSEIIDNPNNSQSDLHEYVKNMLITFNNHFDTETK